MADWRWTVSELEQALKDYIAIRRGLGFQLRLPAGYLRNFVAFLQAEGASHITSVAFCVLGKAITSRILSWSERIAVSLSNPNAIPPCGGAPYLNASNKKPKRFWASVLSIPIANLISDSSFAFSRWRMLKCQMELGANPGFSNGGAGWTKEKSLA